MLAKKLHRQMDSEFKKRQQLLLQYGLHQIF